MKGIQRFTIYHGFAASLALHSAVGLSFVLHGVAAPPEEPSPLVFELQGLLADSQAEQKVQQETGEAKPDEAKAPPSEDRPKDVAADDREAAKPPPEPDPSPAKTQATAGANREGAEEQQNAQTIRNDREAEIDRLKDYVKLLSKKVQSRLVYPDEGRQAGLQGAATVSFAILPTGQIRPETLRVVESSGQPKLDASALKTVRSSVPFAPPPREMTVAIAVAFGRKH